MAVTRVALVGLRCTGKTTVGRLLAARLGWNAADSDDHVEVLAGRAILNEAKRQQDSARRSVAAIFLEDGEARFREWEADAIRDLCKQDKLVIATGGGAVLRPETRSLLSQSCFVVWLTASLETIGKRLTADPETLARRPSLTGAGVTDEVAAVLAAREPLYREVAHLVVATDGRSPDDIAAEIERTILAKG